MATLYGLTNYYEDVVNRGFVVDEETGEILFDESNIGELAERYEDKISAYLAVINRKKSCIAELDRLSELKKSYQKQIAALENSVLNSMERLEITSLDLPEFQVCIRNNPPSVTILDESALPQEFIKQKVTTCPDKQGIKQAILNGQEVTGACLTKGKRLVVK